MEKCQEVACQDPHWAAWFARYIPGADIEKCQEVACQDPKWAAFFAGAVPGADTDKCIKACKGTIHETILNKFLTLKNNI